MAGKPNATVPRQQGLGNTKTGYIRNIEKIIVDTCHFKGNYPDTCSIEGCVSDNNEDVVNNKIEWQTILPAQKLSADAEHTFIKEIINSSVFSHVRLNIFPDGGISRLRLLGKKKN
jgi:allantoicase